MICWPGVNEISARQENKAAEHEPDGYGHGEVVFFLCAHTVFDTLLYKAYIGHI